jgi:hypothetical protein
LYRGVGGAGLAAWVRERQCQDGTAIVSMSASMEQLAPPLVDRHYSKPFDFSALRPSIESACQDLDWLHGFR